MRHPRRWFNTPNSYLTQIQQLHGVPDLSKVNSVVKAFDIKAFDNLFALRCQNLGLGISHLAPDLKLMRCAKETGDSTARFWYRPRQTNNATNEYVFSQGSNALTTPNPHHAQPSPRPSRCRVRAVAVAQPSGAAVATCTTSPPALAAPPRLAPFPMSGRPMGAWVARRWQPCRHTSRHPVQGADKLVVKRRDAFGTAGRGCRIAPRWRPTPHPRRRPGC